MIWVNVGLPSVNVPVLSKMIPLIFFACSRLAAFLIKMPFLAAIPKPAVNAVGVARPRAQGHAITNTAIACKDASAN